MCRNEKLHAFKPFEEFVPKHENCGDCGCIMTSSNSYPEDSELCLSCDAKSFANKYNSEDL